MSSEEYPAVIKGNETIEGGITSSNKGDQSIFFPTNIYTGKRILTVQNFGEFYILLPTRNI